MNKIKGQRQERQQKKRQRNLFLMLIVGGLFLVFAGFSIAKSTGNKKADPSLIEVSGQPSLKVDQELIDYGDVKLNTNLTFDIQLTNVGDAPLEISSTPYVEVKEGC